ncbi:MAG: acetylxylan esterase [Planctomycetaceae bacterium]|nr:acetylxylan esterase [Planctomycetaceae bacterium]
MARLTLTALMTLLALNGLSFGQDKDQGKPWTAKPEVIEKFESRRGDFIYRESKVPEYQLPDPLMTTSGSRVTTPQEWMRTRRPELLQLFRDTVYGNRPDVDYKMSYQVLEEKTGLFEGKAVGRSMQATVTIGDRSYSYPFTLFIPTKAKKPVPAVIHINNRYFLSMDKVIEEHDPFWPVRTLIDRGYATASFHTSDVCPDKKDGYEEGVRAFFADGKPPEDKAWRSLSAWGWAGSRILDHLETLKEIDSSRVAIVGHSRGGKTSLWAACEDQRFAIGYSNNSGCGGAALSRRAYGETVARITSSFPHWFCPPFADYGGRENELPVDQHEIFALLVPRAAYVTSADEDLWADPRGEYLSVVASKPVFELFGKKSIGNSTMPALNSPRHVGNTGYHIRTGGHGLEQQDWDWFLDFADGQFKK